MENILIKKVASKKDLKNFILFPWKVYKDDQNWVPPLVMDFKEKLDKKKNPFFKHADMELFLAYKNNEVHGRIAAIINRRHNQFHQEKVVFFGLYESFNDLEVAHALLDQVAEFGKERGMEIIRGPMNLSINDECAFLLEGFDSPPVIMMPYNPPYYLELMEKCGLYKAIDLYAFYMTKDHKTADKVQEIVEKIKKNTTVTLRIVNLKNLREEVKKIKYIYNNAWEKNWGAVPWTDEEMAHIADRLKTLADPNLVILAEDKGKPIGFAFGLPDYNELIKKMNGRLTPLGIIKFFLHKKKIKGMRAIVFGVLKEYRHIGISYLLYSELEKNAQKRGYEWCETSWQLEDNDAINNFTISIGGRVYKKYRIYEKKLNNTFYKNE